MGETVTKLTCHVCDKILNVCDFITMEEKEKLISKGYLPDNDETRKGVIFRCGGCGSILGIYSGSE